MTPKQKEINRIVERLSQAIAQHKLPPGMRLVEAQLVDTLEANRNHVQAALQRLAIQHIVHIEPNRGAMVAQPTAAEARDVFSARRAIERGIVELITPTQIARYRDRISAHMQRELAATRSQDRQAIVRELSHFHLLLGEICGNQVLHEILLNLMTRSSLIVALYQRGDEPACAHGEHQQIIDALAAGERDRALTLMLEHLNKLEGQLDLSVQEARSVDLRRALSA